MPTAFKTLSLNNCHSNYYVVPDYAHSIHNTVYKYRLFPLLYRTSLRYPKINNNALIGCWLVRKLKLSPPCVLFPLGEASDGINYSSGTFYLRSHYWVGYESCGYPNSVFLLYLTKLLLLSRVALFSQIISFLLIQVICGRF